MYKILKLKGGRWVRGAPRTLDSIKHHLALFNLKKLKQIGKKGKVKPADFFNCINDPIQIMNESGYGAGSSPILGGYLPDPLHDIFLGSPNDLFKILRKLCPVVMERFMEKFHLKMSEGKTRLPASRSSSIDTSHV